MKIFTSKFLNGLSLNVGQRLEATIVAVEQDKLGIAKQARHVVYFAELEQGLSLNKGNADLLIACFGNETDAWLGKKVTVWRKENVFNPSTGETGPAVRLEIDGKVPKERKA